jgi:hypothetical protein
MEARSEGVPRKKGFQGAGRARPCAYVPDHASFTTKTADGALKEVSVFEAYWAP